MRRVLGLAFATLLVAAGCGSETEPRDDAGGSTPGVATADAPASSDLSVEDALASMLEGPLLVRGGLIADGKHVRLCSGFAESYPPQCAGAALELVGFDLTAVPKLKREGTITWSDEPVRVLGRIEGNVLRATSTTR
jgi:hypothetical protein